MRTECNMVGSGDNRVPGWAECATTTWHIIMLPHIRFSVWETPQTDMTEWYARRMETKAERVTTFIQLEGPTKDSFCGKPDWQPVLSLGISAFKMQFNNHFSLLPSSVLPLKDYGGRSWPQRNRKTSCQGQRKKKRCCTKEKKKMMGELRKLEE